MSASVTMSFSVPIELSIQMEECMENEKIKRSELIKKALSLYFDSKDKSLNNNVLIKEVYDTVNQIRDLITKK